MKKTITTLAAVAAIAALAGCGAGKAQEAVANAAPLPTVTVTQPAPPAVTTTIQSIPQACLDALDNADEGFGYGAEAMAAAGEFDVPGITAATAKLNRLAPTYQANKAECRAAGN